MKSCCWEAVKVDCILCGRAPCASRRHGLCTLRVETRRGVAAATRGHSSGAGQGALGVHVSRTYRMPCAELGGGAARRLRTGDRPACGERHRPHQDADRSRADRALSHGRHRRLQPHADRRARPLRRGRRRRIGRSISSPISAADASFSRTARHRRKRRWRHERKRATRHLAWPRQRRRPTEIRRTPRYAGP